MKLRLDVLEPNRWNANEVTGEKYLLLVKDMREAGQREPIVASPYPVFYPAEDKDPEHPYTTPLAWDGFFVICDGEHRYKAALELGWEELEATVEELTEDEAVTRFYRQQATRGGFDPLREARMFQHYLDDGLTQEQVVEKLGLSSDSYLTDRLALLNLSPLVQEILANLKGMLASRIKERATNETQEELRELTDEILERSGIETIKLRYISTLPENDQGLLVSSMLDTFIEGGTVTTRQVAQMVRTIREKIDRQKTFMKAWETAKVKNCPQCKNPPTDFVNEEARLFRCARLHTWRYDKTSEELEEEKKQVALRLLEERRLRDEGVAKANKARDAHTIEQVLGMHTAPVTLQQLQVEFYRLGDYADLGQSRKALSQYLEGHPDVRLKEPLTPEQLDEARLQAEKQRAQSLREKLERDAKHLKRIITLYGDILTRKQLYTDYMELSRTISPQDGRDVIALYLEQHPEITFPGDEPVKVREPDATDRAVSAALGQPPMPEEQPKKGRVYYTIKVEELEEDAPVREGGCRFGYSYNTGQGGGAGPIGDSESFLNTVERMVREIWKAHNKMKSYPKPSVWNTVVEVCKAAADEGLITEAEIWNALITHPLNEAEEKDNRPKGDLCDGCTEDCDKCPHEDEESDEDLDEDESLEEGESDATIGSPPTPAEPPSVTLIATADELHQRIVPWILGKIGELSDVTSIHLEGLRDKEEVLIGYAEPDWKGRSTFSFRVQTTTPISKTVRHVDAWKWLSFNAAQQTKGLKLTSGKLGQATQEDLDQISRFLNDAVYTDLDPWDEPTIMGPTGFTLTPVNTKELEEAPNLDAGEEHHEHYERDEEPEDLPTCPTCGKQSPNSHYCTSCGALFDEKPQEEMAHGLTPSEELWGSTGTGKLGGLANALSLEEALWLRGRETRRRALKHLDRRIAELRLEGAPTIKLEED